jgi:hypothetical protein
MTDSTRLRFHGSEVCRGTESEGLLGDSLVAGTSSLFVVLLAVKVSEFVIVIGLFARQLCAAAI